MWIWLSVSFLNLLVDLVVRVQITHQTWHVFLSGNVIDVKGHLKLCKISGDILVKNESRLLLARAGKQQLSF